MSEGWYMGKQWQESLWPRRERGQIPGDFPAKGSGPPGTGKIPLFCPGSFICLIPGDVNLDHLVKAVSACFFTEVTTFPVVLNNYLGGDTLRL